MARLLDELLGLARLHGGELPDLVRQPVDLVSLLGEVIGEYRGQSVRKRIQLAVRDESVVGLWDPWRLERVLGNLLNNAVKYSPQGGEINLTVGREQDALGHWAVLTIVDRGLGIPADDIASVFERFHRGANVRGRIDGSGIGLAGARRIVEEHGGSLEVESQEGVGSTFTLRLPIAPASDDAAAEAGVGASPDSDVSEVLSILSRCKVLEPIPAAGLARLAKDSRIRKFASGATLVQQGQMSESVFLVVDGSVRAERSTDGVARSLVLADLGPGTVIDEMGVLDRAPQTATVTAREDTLAVEVPASAVAEILLRYPQLATGLAGDLHHRLRTANKRKA
jgi:two-component sensor histidine kinase